MACGHPDSARVADLLPHYSSLLDLLDSQYSEGQLTTSKLYQCLGALRFVLSAHQSHLEGYVDYAAMLISMAVAYRRYYNPTMADAPSFTYAAVNAANKLPAATAAAMASAPAASEASGLTANQQTVAPLQLAGICCCCCCRWRSAKHEHGCSATTALPTRAVCCW
jgi:hypothetical protein